MHMMEGVLENVAKNPFDAEEHHHNKPLYAALVPDEIFISSHFERRFVTPFGKIWQQLALIIAEDSWDEVAQEYRLTGNIQQERLNRITTILNELERPKANQNSRQPHWQKELQFILKGRGKMIPIQVTCDLWLRRGQDIVTFELKAPLPNSDQTKVSKEKLFKLYAIDQTPITSAFFALPYNPYGKRENYAWSMPKRWFDMSHDPVILMGSEFWDYIGGTGCYDVLITAVEELGDRYKTRIYRDILKRNPP